MKNKTFALFALSVLVFTLFVGAVSASFTLDGSVIPTSVAQDTGTFKVTFNLTNSYAADHTVDWTTSSTVNGGSATLSFSPVNGTNIVAGTVVPVTLTVNFNKTFTGVISGNIIATPSAVGTPSAPLPFSVTITPTTLPAKVFDCLNTEAVSGHGNLAVTIDDVNVDDGYGDGTDWYPLDSISVKVNVENNGPEKIRNIDLRWGLYDEQSGRFIIDDKESSFSLSDGDNNDVTVKFKLNEHVSDLNDNNFKLYVWAEGEDHEAPIGNTCATNSESINVKVDSDFVVLNNIQAPTDSVQCKDTVTITADAFNIGDSDEKDVYALVNGKDLGLVDQRIDIGKIDSLTKTPVEFTFSVPPGLKEKTYAAKFSLYDKNGNLFESDNNDESVFTVPVTVKGNCGASAGSAAVSATLESGGKAGEAMVVKTTVANKGTSAATFTVNAAGYSAWASAASVSEDSFTLEAGKSKDVTIALQTKADAKGEQTFNVEVLSGNEIVMTQPVSVMVEGKSAGFLSAITGNATGDGKSLWIIGALNVLLVFAIIVIAIRFLLRR